MQEEQFAPIQEDDIQIQRYESKSISAATKKTSFVRDRAELILSNNTLTEDESSGIDRMEDFEELATVTSTFEEQALGLKLELNKLEVLSSRASALPITLKLCFQQLKKSIADENPDFDQQDIEQSVMQITKSCNLVSRDFTKLKVDYFQTTEGFVNKDLNFLKLTQVKNQGQKINKVADKLIENQQSFQEVMEQLDELKQQYQQFEEGIFRTKNNQIQQIGQRCNHLSDGIQENVQVIENKINQCKDLVSKMQIFTKEQRSMLAEINLSVGRAERKLQKSLNNFENQMVQRQQVALREEQCDQICSNLKAQDLKGLLNQTKSFEKLMECSKQCATQQAKFEIIDEEIKKILIEVEDIFGKLKALEDLLQNSFRDEFEQISNQISSTSEEIYNQVKQQMHRIDQFEIKINSIQIPENDLILIHKDINKYREMLAMVETQIDSIQERISDVKCEIELRDNQLITAEDMEMAKQSLKTVDKIKMSDMPKIIQMIDNLENHLLKSLRSLLSDDNKKSQSQISKMKKNYEELQRQIEAVTLKFTDCRHQINNFEEEFENEDLERLNQIMNLDEQLQDEEINIYGKAEEDDPFDDSTVTRNSLQKMKRDIIQHINTLVTLFNENNKQIKEHNLNKSQNEKEMNDLINKNSKIQNQCNDLNNQVEEAKLFCCQISSRLDTIVYADLIEDLMTKYKEKNENIDHCEQLQNQTVSQMEKIDNLISKNMTQVNEMSEKLDKVNLSINSGEKFDESFKEKLSNRTMEMTQTREELEGYKLKLDEYIDEVEKVMNPLTFMAEIEVKLDPQILEILSNMQKIEGELLKLESSLQPSSSQLIYQAKAIKQLIDLEITRKLQDSKKTISDIDGLQDNAVETQNQAKKRLKYYKDLLLQAMKKQGAADQILNEKLVELNDEEYLIEKELNDQDYKFKDLHKKMNDAKKAATDINKNPDKYLPQQLDNMLQNLEEIQDKARVAKEKFNGIDKQILQKIDDLQKLLETSDSKKEMQNLVEETHGELKDDLIKLKAEIDKLGPLSQDMLKTLGQMNQDSIQGGDYYEIKDDIKEYTDDLEELQDDIQSMNQGYNNCKMSRLEFKIASTKGMNIENLKKALENLNMQKNNITNIFTDIHSVNEQISDMKMRLDDCKIQTNISKRKNCLNSLTFKLNNLNKEFQNLKKAKNQEKNSKEYLNQFDAIEKRLKKMTQDKNGLVTILELDLESIKPNDYHDFAKNHETVRKIRELKNKINEMEDNIKALEQQQKDVVRMFTELDMENSIGLLGTTSVHLKERLQHCEEKLKLISGTGEAMDGNTSTQEEEEFIFALTKEMPEVFENITTTFKLIDEIDNLVLEVKHTMDPSKMVVLQEKTGLATDNVEQSESLLHQLEKEVIDMSGQQKLLKRDGEIEKMHHESEDLIEYLAQEKSNTLVEIDKNLEKQEENRDQEMVDKEGNKVEIMDDLVKLEGEMRQYIKDIDDLDDQMKTFQTFFQQCHQEFNHDLPKLIIELRKIKQKECKDKNDNRKRPPQFLSKKKNEKGENENDQDSNYNMLMVNCKYRKRVKNLNQQFDEILECKKELNVKYEQMRKHVFAIKQIKLYKPLKGDVVDEMFANCLNKAKVEIDVQRISANNYMFGTKKILAKIINGQLVIRVGGGYMNADEFIEQYSKIEMMKIIRLEEHKEKEAAALANGTQSRLGTRQHGSGMMASQVKDQMRNTLMSLPQFNKGSDMNQSLGGMRSSYKVTKMAAPRMSVQVGAEQDLKAALDGMKQKLTQTPSKRADGRRMTINPNAFQGLVAHGGSSTLRNHSPPSTLKPNSTTNATTTRNTLKDVSSKINTGIGKGVKK